MAEGSEVQVPGARRTLNAYRALPAGGRRPAPGLMVIHEIFGLDDHIRDVSQRLAKEGYVVLAPNLYTGPLARQMTPENVRLALKAFAEAPPGLRADPSLFKQFIESQPAERRPVLEAFAIATDPLTQEAFAEDMRAAMDDLRKQPGVDPARTGALGFCFGGSMVGRYATVDPQLGAAIIFYGHNPPAERLKEIRARVLGLYASEDPGITATIPDFARAMAAAGKEFQYHVYPGAKHAFFNDRRPNYHEESARDAWRRVLEFLEMTLSSPGPAGPRPRR